MVYLLYFPGYLEGKPALGDWGELHPLLWYGPGIFSPRPFEILLGTKRHLSSNGQFIERIQGKGTGIGSGPNGVCIDFQNGSSGPSQKLQ